ncbi:MAG: RNA 2',3'-cyclic phosphodiesterase [Treponema sp.]|nr:RNA 2',3'-cyclic phosphodiesterase [Treponema sp.]
MRLFIAVNFDDEVKGRVLFIQDRIREQALRGNFSRPENLHLTLAFIGETPEAQVPVVCSVLADLRYAPFELDFSCLGFFSHSRKELWWIGADQKSAGHAALLELRKALCAGLLAKGIAFDNRPFNAHITLGREIKHLNPIDAPAPRIAVPVRRISLMKSERVKGALTYTEIGAQDLRQGHRLSPDKALPHVNKPLV